MVCLKKSAALQGKGEIYSNSRRPKRKKCAERREGKPWFCFNGKAFKSKREEAAVTFDLESGSVQKRELPKAGREKRDRPTVLTTQKYNL